jgi:hypothetical protein
MIAVFIARGVTLSTAMLLVGCNSSGRESREPQTGPRADPNAAKPAIYINASQSAVHEELTRRAAQRGTKIVEVAKSGVKLEVGLNQSSPIVEIQCGPHQVGRVLQVVVSTEPFGSGTAVTEDRFIIDGSDRRCKLNLTSSDLEEGKGTLAGLKRQVEERVGATRRDGIASR